MRYSPFKPRLLSAILVLGLTGTLALSAYLAVDLWPAAASWVSMGGYDQALDNARLMVKREPKNREARLLLAMLLREEGETGRVETAYRLALTSREDQPYLQTVLGELRLDREEWTESAGYFQRALKADPEMTRASIGLSRALVGQNKQQEAVALLRDLMQRSVAAEGFYLLGDILKGLGVEPVELIAVYSRGTAANPTDVGMHLRLARALSSAGETAKAEAEYLIVLRWEPDNAEARAALDKSG